MIGGVFLFELLMTVGAWIINPTLTKSITAPIPANVSNTEALGLVLYTKYIYYFQIAGVVLLVAMIGAIVLTLRHKVRCQAAGHQCAKRTDAGTGDAGAQSRDGPGPAGRGCAEWVQ